MINFIRRYIIRKAEEISAENRQKDLNYIKKLEADNDYLRDKTTRFTLEGDPDHFWTLFFQTHKQVKTLKPGQKIDTCLHMGDVELVRVEAFKMKDYDCLKDYKIIINVHNRERNFTQYELYGKGDYWHFDKERKEYLSSYRANNEHQLLDKYLKFLDSFTFFPSTGH
jgi:hypothetical protein